MLNFFVIALGVPLLAAFALGWLATGHVNYTVDAGSPFASVGSYVVAFDRLLLGQIMLLSGLVRNLVYARELLVGITGMHTEGEATPAAEVPRRSAAPVNWLQRGLGFLSSARRVQARMAGHVAREIVGEHMQQRQRGEGAATAAPPSSLGSARPSASSPAGEGGRALTPSNGASLLLSSILDRAAATRTAAAIAAPAPAPARAPAQPPAQPIPHVVVPPWEEEEDEQEDGDHDAGTATEVQQQEVVEQQQEIAEQQQEVADEQQETHTVGSGMPSPLPPSQDAQPFSQSESDE